MAVTTTQIPNERDTLKEKPLCFVIGPIGAKASPTRMHADWLLKGIIKPTLEDPEFGYQVKRADDELRPGMISDAMINDIVNAALVVADLSELNPNAFYELAIRHGAIKPVIHIARAGTVPPFDNAGHGVIFVDIGDIDDVEAARKRLADTARAIRAPDYRVTNPITHANTSFRLRESEDPTDRVLAEIQFKIDRLEGNVATLGLLAEQPTGGVISPLAYLHPALSSPLDQKIVEATERVVNRWHLPPSPTRPGIPR